jgi:hypothetical protein
MGTCTAQPRRVERIGSETAANGGQWGFGAVIQIAPDQTVSTLVSFPSASIGLPSGELMLDSAGNLYGTTHSFSGVTVFELAPAGTTLTDVSLNIRAIPTKGSADNFNGIAEDSLGNVYVTSDKIYKLSSIPFADTVTGTPAADSITLSQDPDHHNTDWSVNGDASSLLPINDANGLTINGNGGNDIITLDYSNGNPLPATLHLNGTFTIDGLQGADPLAGRALDIGTSTVYLNYGSPSNDPIFAIRQYFQNGYQEGAWNGTPASSIDGVITSSAAQNNTAGTTGVGFADWADGQGVNTTPNTIELKYTLDGDANLDGQVNSADLQILLFGLNRAGSWDQGDFNYDGQVNSADLQTLLATLNTRLGSQAGPMAVAAPPATMANSATQSTNDASTNHVPAINTTGSTTAVDHRHTVKPAAKKRH